MPGVLIKTKLKSYFFNIKIIISIVFYMVFWIPISLFVYKLCDKTSELITFKLHLKYYPLNQPIYVMDIIYFCSLETDKNMDIGIFISVYIRLRPYMFLI